MLFRSEKSKQLIREQGWAAINIRSVAAACGVSIGSIYNYFDSKADLIAATIESVWYDIFHFSEQERKFDSFLSCVQWIFDSIKKGEEKYPQFFTLHTMSFLEEEKSSGQRLMTQSWKHIQKGLYTVLINDKGVQKNAFNQEFTPEKFVEVIFSLIISALMHQNYDCSIILEIIKRTIYK